MTIEQMETIEIDGKKFVRIRFMDRHKELVIHVANDLEQIEVPYDLRTFHDCRIVDCHKKLK